MRKHQQLLFHNVHKILRNKNNWTECQKIILNLTGNWTCNKKLKKDNNGFQWPSGIILVFHECPKYSCLFFGWTGKLQNPQHCYSITVLVIWIFFIWSTQHQTQKKHLNILAPDIYWNIALISCVWAYAYDTVHIFSDKYSTFGG